jgi:hypothetical protein
MKMNDSIAGYDVIGDIHGHGDELLALLQKLGYYHDGMSYCHDNRQVLFLGDFIDRGPKQRLVLETVMAMCKRGAAHAIMGNHEFNALAYHTEYPVDSGTWLRPRNDKNTKQHLAFLDEYLYSPKELRCVLDWFMELPLWLEFEEGLRLVHACWHEPSIQRLKSSLGSENTLTSELLIKASESGSDAYQDVETLLKGRELTLPENITFTDKDGFERREIRIKWWLNEADTYADLALPAYVVERNPQLQTEVLPVGLDIGYAQSQPPVMFGHYWFEGHPTLEATNVACLDYSVPRATGKLVAYRWSGEKQLSAQNFTSVENITDSNL